MHALIEWLLRIDRNAFEWVILNANPSWLVDFAEAAGQTNLLFLVGCIALLMGFRYDIRKTLFAAGFVVIFLLLSEISVSFLKEFFARPRPGMQMGIYADPRGFSFPSAHSFNTAALAALVSLKLRRYHSLAWSIAILTGICRVLANYHFPLDVFAGWILGASFTAIVLGIIDFFIDYVQPAARVKLNLIQH